MTRRVPLAVLVAGSAPAGAPARVLARTPELEGGAREAPEGERGAPADEGAHAAGPPER